MTSAWAAILATVILGIAVNYWQIRAARERRAAARAAEQKELAARLDDIEASIAEHKTALAVLDRGNQARDRWEHDMRALTERIQAALEKLTERRGR